MSRGVLLTHNQMLRHTYPTGTCLDSCEHNRSGHTWTDTHRRAADVDVWLESLGQSYRQHITEVDIYPETHTQP